MKNIFYLSILSGLFTIASCISPASKENATASTPAPKAATDVKIPDGPLAQKLYKNYHAAPTTQAAMDENKLIEYAVTKNLDVSRSNSGLYYSIKKENDAETIKKGGPVIANYKGYTLDGKVFDSSYDRGEPIKFNEGQMIPGWNEALLMMNPGSKATLLIPSHLAYGPRGYPGLIGPNEPLVFEMEVLTQQ